MKRQAAWGASLLLLGIGTLRAGAQSTDVSETASVGSDPRTGIVREDPAEAPRLTAADTKIDVVFALDTTGSMGGLIESAKRKIWSIANAIALAEPRPEIRMGLVAYRDRSDEYVTRLTPLTPDLDAIFSELMSFRAEGGGDGPESVNQALHEAVTRMDWDRGASTLRLVYLVGDAEPHLDYEQDVHYTETCALAARSGIFINSIQCGSSDTTRRIWQEIALGAEGSYFAIDAAAATPVATPFDEELARLGSEMDGTVLYYGPSDVVAESVGRKERAGELAGAAAPSAMADRAVYNSSEAGLVNFVGSKELVEDLRQGRVDLDALPASELPAELRELSPEAQRALIEQKATQRGALQVRIQELGAQRRLFLEEASKRDAGKAGTFDSSVLGALYEQAERKGIRFEGVKPPAPPAESDAPGDAPEAEVERPSTGG